MLWLQPRIRLGILALLVLLLALLVIDRLCYALTLPVEIDIQGGVGTLHVGSQTILLGAMGAPTQLQFAAHDPVVHEYQLDGTDSTNNFTLDTTYLHDISSSAYYRFQAWMRDLDGTSRWRDVQIQANQHLFTHIDWVADGTSVSLPSQDALRIQLQLQRPETPMTLLFVEKDGTTISILFDRNDRQIAITHSGPTITTPAPPAKTFFP